MAAGRGARRRWPGLRRSRWSPNQSKNNAPRSSPLCEGLLQALGEEGEHPVEGVARGVTGLVDEVLGEHRVRAARNAVRVALRRIDLHRDERVAELAAQGLESLARSREVLGEAQAHDAGTVLCAFLHAREVGVAHADSAA